MQPLIRRVELWRILWCPLRRLISCRSFSEFHKYVSKMKWAKFDLFWPLCDITDHRTGINWGVWRWERQGLSIGVSIILIRPLVPEIAGGNNPPRRSWVQKHPRRWWVNNIWILSYWFQVKFDGTSVKTLFKGLQQLVFVSSQLSCFPYPR